MVYDMRNHLPQVIEEMRQDIHAENVKGLKRNRKFLEKSFDGFETSFKAAERIRDEKRRETWKEYVKAIDRAVNHDVNKKIEDIEIDAAVASNKQMEKLNDHEESYWETILGKTIRFNRHEFTELIKKQEEP